MEELEVEKVKVGIHLMEEVGTLGLQVVLMSLGTVESLEIMAAEG